MWNCIALKATGLHHRSSQDACQIAVEGEFLIMAVADGAGSAAYGQMGAKLASYILMHQAKRIILEQRITGNEIEFQIRHAFSAAKKGIERAARSRKCSEGELATTSILAITTPAMLVTGHVGDGGVVGLKRDGYYFPASRPECGRYSHHTYFLTDDDYEQHLRISVVQQRLEAIAAFTDGVQAQVLCDSGVNHNFIAPYFRDLSELAPNEAKVKLTDYLHDLKAVTDDDVTIALACRGNSK